MHIGFNKYQFYGKLIVLISVFLIFVVIFLGFIQSWSSGRNFLSTPTPIPAAIFLILLYSFLFFSFILMSLQLILLPKGLIINEMHDSITIEFFLFRSETITIKDIREYFTIIVITRSERYNGVFIQLINGKGIVLADANLKDTEPIKNFLKKNNVTFSGHDSKFSFIRFFRNNYINNKSKC